MHGSVPGWISQALLFPCRDENRVANFCQGLRAPHGAASSTVSLGWLSPTSLAAVT